MGFLLMKSNNLTLNGISFVAISISISERTEAADHHCSNAKANDNTFGLLHFEFLQDSSETKNTSLAIGYNFITNINKLQ